jgi:putative transposase
MAHNLVRFQQSGDLHFLTFSCYRRRPYLGTPRMRELFEGSLEAMRVKYDFYINAYVVMPEHVHLLVSEPKKAVLAKAIQALKISVSMQQKERPFWQHRYHDFNVYSQHKFQQKMKYIHRNPVTRGLVERPEDWEWSSFRHYAMGVAGRVEVESSWLASARERASANTPISKCERSGAPA